MNRENAKERKARNEKDCQAKKFHLWYNESKIFLLGGGMYENEKDDPFIV